MWSKTKWLVVLVGFVTLGVALAVLGNTVATNRSRIHAGAARNAHLEVQLVRQQSASVALARQVRRLGHKPVVTPPVITGPSGPQGQRGLRGAKGFQGERGVAGIQGLQGLRGLQGLLGPQGDKGDTGATGATGAPGQNGAPGAAGDPGPTGPQGDQGQRGEQGPQGEQGPKGDRGDTGPAGYPASWTWTDMLGQTYTCTDPDGDHSYSCTRG